jgi:hypothetical protein
LIRRAVQGPYDGNRVARGRIHCVQATVEEIVPLFLANLLPRLHVEQVIAAVNGIFDLAPNLDGFAPARFFLGLIFR